MEIKKAEFIISAASRSQYPQDGRVEVAFVGRSNVGKSSIINALTNRKSLAKVGNTPGKTRLINFFLINDDFYLVDLPGYGYAKVSKGEKEKWGRLMEDYLTGRETLKKVVLLVDSRHKPTEDDVMMIEWIRYHGYDIQVIATKADKISRNEMQKNKKIIKETLKVRDEELFFFSSTKREGKEELINKLFDDLSANNNIAEPMES
ncbi:MAG: YihA family ribosome biogenesis GTP-binding protein [Clostridiales bacterium]|uniref:ribosome biogenesis GTP-binding protein YihA/YsxC n=1 Tax=Clostridium sp. N3C TaxID=1776758 RepID=UPI00092DF771|nr:ribosome biogenesis GTP-binding protein YihA/YsxC [Clostridium sp. N3C]NLZ49230.1 YihA family ribosome biogenesis GTP-binding protein [Clostridiales bacterium]SCN22387.1 putative GTP-binding protein EngB [Clostridium sp. N3C]